MQPLLTATDTMNLHDVQRHRSEMAMDAPPSPPTPVNDLPSMGSAPAAPRVAPAPVATTSAAAPGDYLSSFGPAAPLPPPRGEGALPARENPLEAPPLDARAAPGVALKLVHVRTGEVRRIAACDGASLGALTARARALWR